MAGTRYELYNPGVEAGGTEINRYFELAVTLHVSVPPLHGAPLASTAGTSQMPAASATYRLPEGSKLTP